MRNNDSKPQLESTSVRKASFGQTVKAVLWSFFGIRRGRDHDADMAQLNPLHVIIVGLIAAALFVFTLLMIVRQVVA